MTNQTPLSEKEKIYFVEGIGLNLHYYKPFDVRDAVRRLKNKVSPNIYSKGYIEVPTFNNWLEEIFGKELCEDVNSQESSLMGLNTKEVQDNDAVSPDTRKGCGKLIYFVDNVSVRCGEIAFGGWIKCPSCQDKLKEVKEK